MQPVEPRSPMSLTLPMCAHSDLTATPRQLSARCQNHSTTLSPALRPPARGAGRPVRPRRGGAARPAHPLSVRCGLTRAFRSRSADEVVDVSDRCAIGQRHPPSWPHDVVAQALGGPVGVRGAGFRGVLAAALPDRRPPAGARAVGLGPHYPLLVVHVVCSSIAIVTCVVQIWPWLRGRFPASHRRIGRGVRPGSGSSATTAGG